MNLFDAIYARQSVDRIDSISVESQIEFCKKEVTGESYKVYTDKGYSGKNIDRPAFQDLLRDIEAGKVNRVIVYRLDRISRSVLDFANVIDIFQKHKVDFVSTMEKFDTGTPIGKAMLMIVMIFAQLERETIQQRVIDAYSLKNCISSSLKYFKYDPIILQKYLPFSLEFSILNLSEAVA